MLLESAIYRPLTTPHAHRKGCKMAGTSLKTLRFHPFNTNGPKLAYHVAGLVGTDIYVHGGIEKHGSKDPSRRLYKFNITSKSWSEIESQGSPALSHHCCVVYDNCYLILIGGWDGKQRTSDVYAFDTHNHSWRHLPASGFPVGAGLSSHTSTLLTDGSILIIGREGSLRTQRRSGNAFMLTGTIKHGFKYSDYALGVASRSGHCTVPVGTRLVTIGGRSDKLVEQYQGFKVPSLNESTIMTHVKTLAKQHDPMPKPPCGRKHHIAVAGKGCVFLHGGETFDGRNRDPVGEMYLVTLQDHLSWIKLNVSDIGRQGHVAIATDDDIFIHGGEGLKYGVRNEMFQLTFS